MKIFSSFVSESAISIVIGIAVKRDTYHRLFFHIVWSTKFRMAAFEASLDRSDMIQILREAAAPHGARIFAINVWHNHVHLLVSLPPCDIARFVGHCKGSSAFVFNRREDVSNSVVWQDGYGIVSLRHSDIKTVIRYIENQEEHHATNRQGSSLEIDGIDEPT